MTPAAELRRLLAEDDVLIVPGVTNVLDALLAERVGFPAVFTTGAGIANAMHGLPDLGLITLTEITDVTRRVANAIGRPVITDADTGYGNHLNVIRTISELELAGSAAIVIEDQVSPKRCGHLDGKALIAVEQMVEKLIAAAGARRNPDTVLFARTDAIAVEGFDAALERAVTYVEAGADVIFVEAPVDEVQLAAIPRAIPAPCMLNLVEGGRTPLVTRAELQELGYKIGLYANLALRIAARAVEDAFGVLIREGTSTSLLDDMLSWDERQSRIGLPAWERADVRIGEEAGRLVSATKSGNQVIQQQVGPVDV